MNEKQFQELRKRLEPYIVRMVESGTSRIATGTTVLDETLLIDYLKRDGTRSLLGNLTVADLITIDGVDISELNNSYNSHLITDSHTIYAHADGSGTRSAYKAERLNKSIVAGTALVGGGLLDTNQTLNHDAGSFGDLHTNYTEHESDEYITGTWGFSENTLFELGLTTDAGVTGDGYIQLDNIPNAQNRIKGRMGIGDSTGSSNFVLDALYSNPYFRLGNVSTDSTDKAGAVLGLPYSGAGTLANNLPLIGYQVTGTSKVVSVGYHPAFAALTETAIYGAATARLRANTDGLGLGANVTPNAATEVLIAPASNAKKALRLKASDATNATIFDVVTNLDVVNAYLTTGGDLKAGRVGVDTSTFTAVLTTRSNSVTPAFRIEYDNTNLADFTVDNGGNITFSPTGGIRLNPAQRDILPTQQYFINLGSIQKKFLTIHAAELWVETLVAQNTIATIGGRILVGATTTLTRDLASGATTIYVKHNQMTANDIVYMEGWNGTSSQVEFMQITSSGTLQGAGDYAYTVTRNLDTSGANDWLAGDAVFNTGVVGDGFIDLYALNGVTAGSTSGPTIAFNVRNSLTYNDWSNHAVIGNLKGTYDYSADIFGFAAGKYTAGTGGLGSGLGLTSWVAADADNGVRIMNGAETLSRWYNDGSLLIGRTGTNQTNVLINSSGMQLRQNVTTLINLNATTGAVLVGQTGLGSNNVLVDSSGARFRLNTTDYIRLNSSGIVTVGNSTAEPYVTVSSGGIFVYDGSGLQQFGVDTAGAILLGRTTAGQNNILFTSGEVRFRTALATNMLFKTTGEIVLGSESGANVKVNSSGVFINHNGNNRIRLDSSGNAYIENLLTLSGSGALIGGNSNVRIDVSGIKMNSDSIYSADKAIKFYSSSAFSTLYGYIQGFNDASAGGVDIVANQITGKQSRVYLSSDGISSLSASSVITISSRVAGVEKGTINIASSTSGSIIGITGSDISISGTTITLSGATTITAPTTGTLSFGLGWTNFDTSVYQTARYFKTAQGLVHLEGLVKRTSGTGTTIGTLPAGYRPTKTLLFNVWATSAAARIDITTAGVITLVTGTPDFVSLDGISFRAA